MKTLTRITLSFLVLSISGLCVAEPTSPPVKIISLRPYMDAGNASAGVVYVTVDSSTFCGTSVFRINLSWGGGKAAYAAALSAEVSGKSVQLEVPTSVGCTGWGQDLQSVYILNQ